MSAPSPRYGSWDSSGRPKLAAPRRHHRPFSSARSRLEHATIVATLAALRALPLESACRSMAAMVGAGPWVSPRLRRVGMENLHRAFPERDQKWCAATLRACFANLGRMAAEVAHLGELGPENVRDRIAFLSDQDEARWKEAVTRDSGTLIATGHLGNWELFAQAQGLLGYPIHLVHRALRNPLLDDLLSRIRSTAGTGVVYKHAAAREVLRLLKQGAMVAIPIDQHQPGASGIAVPFFGRPASTTPGPARLAQLTGVPIQVAVLVRRGETTRHDILVGPPIERPATGDRAADLLATMARVNRAFEEVVRRFPEQWLWMHRRWRLD